MARVEKSGKESKPKLAFREAEDRVEFTKGRGEVEKGWVDVGKSQSFKTLFLGDSNVGKTCLAKLYVEGKVADHSTHTIGFDYHYKELELGDGIVVQLQIWDTAGMEQFRNALITKYYRNADGIIFVYDITNLSSFHGIETWVSEVRQYCEGLENIRMALVGNKLDQSDERVVSWEEGEELARKYGMTFQELSAMDSATLSKLEDLFVSLARDMLREREKREVTLTSSQVIRLSSLSDEWEIVNAPEEPIPRQSYIHQNRARRIGKCRC